MHEVRIFKCDISGNKIVNNKNIILYVDEKQRLGVNYLLISYNQIVQGKRTPTSYHDVLEGTTRRKSFGVNKKTNHQRKS